MKQKNTGETIISDLIQLDTPDFVHKTVIEFYEFRICGEINCFVWLEISFRFDLETINA